MYNEKIESLIKAALTDGVLTEKEKQVLFKRAQEAGIDLDEFEMVLDARLVELQKEEKEKAQKSAPKSDKFGDVRKCPVCGALVPALGVTCAECGYEFSGIEASSSAQLLAKKIEEALAKGKNKESIISNFPIPNAKNDLFDLILYLKNHLANDFKQVYESKLKECLDKAEYLYPSDPLFIKLKEDGKKELNTKKAEETGEDIMALSPSIGMIAALCLYGWMGSENDWGFWGWFGYFYLYLFVGAGIGALIGAIAKKIYIKLKK